jgi:hypothetical protein
MAMQPELAFPCKPYLASQVLQASYRFRFHYYARLCMFCVAARPEDCLYCCHHEPAYRRPAAQHQIDGYIFMFEFRLHVLI